MYKKRSKGLFKHADFVFLDMICLQAAFVLAYIIRLGFSNPYEESLYRLIAIYIELVDIIVLFIFETLKNVLKRGYYIEFSKTLKHTVIALLLDIGILFVIKQGQNFSRAVLAICTVLYFILTYFSRILWKKHIVKRKKNTGSRHLLIFAPESSAQEAVINIRDRAFSDLTVLGLVIIDKDMQGQTIEGVPVVSNMDNFMPYICHEWVDEIFLMYPEENNIPASFTESILETGIVTHIYMPQVQADYGYTTEIGSLGSYAVITSTMNIMSARQAAAKRCMDIAGGLIGCLMTGILFIFIAPAIYIKSPGKIFYKHTRIGQNGKKFSMYKFRSMYPDADERKEELMQENKIKDGLMFKMDFDPRIIGNKVLPDGTKKTGIGEFIRKTSLDEFPQFINVLKGDMSLVGTRPPTPDEWEKYEAHHRARMSVKPGITGMWQVSGRSDIDDFEKVVRLDTWYINNWSLGLDIKILFKTIRNVILKKGAM